MKMNKVKTDSSEHKKAKVVNKNVVARLSHSKYKVALLNSKCFETFNEKNLK